MLVGLYFVLLLGPASGDGLYDTINALVIPALNALTRQSPNQVLFDLTSLNLVSRMGNLVTGEDSGITSKLLNTVVDLEPEVTMHTTQRILYNGYTVQVLTVTTQDGYIVRLDRIGSPTVPINATAIPMLLVPGTFCQSEAFLGNNKENNLPFILADQGRDVFVISFRGSENSLGHTTLSSTDAEYWSFSFDEFAIYDMPSAVDCILNITGHTTLYIGGHSLGGGIPYIFLSALPQYNAKVRGVFSLAPLGRLSDIDNPVVRLLFINEPIIELVAKVISWYKFQLPLSKRELGTLISVMRPLFPLPIMKYIGPDNKNWNQTHAPNYFASLLTSTSTRLLFHFGQFALYNGEKGMRKFDFGKDENIRRYGNETPPTYDLNKVTAPAYLYYGTNDALISLSSTEDLKRNLGNVVLFRGLEGYGHMDFVWANNLPAKLYNSILQIMIQNN